MNLAQPAASRSRSVESEAFFSGSVRTITPNKESSSCPSPYAWKRSLKERIWTDEGPGDIYACRLLEVLVDFADAEGRCWPGIQTLLSKTKIKTERTLQKALDNLSHQKRLRIVPQSWTSLGEVQAAAGKPRPRRGDAGQATNLYILLDGHGREVAFNVPSSPGLVRTAKEPSRAAKTSPQNDRSPLQNDRGGPLQNDGGEPPANLHPDLDQREVFSKEESVERAPRVDPSTHISLKSSKKGAEKLLSWDVLVEAHIEKTKTVYGLPPLPPDLKHADRKALAALLDGAAAEVHAQLHERTGLTHDIAEVRSDLAKRVMHLYFKNDNPHLRRVKHALRDLPREFHARLIEARQALLRESHDAAPPRRVQLEQPIVHVDSVDKPVEETKQEQLEQPKESSTSTHKPASMEGVASADKPVNVAPSKTSEPASPPPPNPPSTSVNTAREARKLLEALSVPSPQQELFKRPSAEVPKPTPLKRPVLPEWMQAELEQARASADKPAPARKSFEQKPLEDKPSSAPPRGQQVERPLGRSGAPRWGAVGPRPAKVRRAPKLAPDDVESGARHGDSSATKP